ncbi:type IV secretory system conjugative DNA transfer family protein [Streptomyces sp. P38-E01]|uniref:Type IV secretory system conjugative DNA transfer family protein n=1 Tax=Streptomyces tardus TaxID=2780544 RepID=A0A949JDM2_9ACTN|nr:type VI secretion protein [Streptomyces tardus]MBU7597986.1 type IV secretory system conjugative DNA transfer family protein [Streptomyces tardus]
MPEYPEYGGAGGRQGGGRSSGGVPDGLLLGLLGLLLSSTVLVWLAAGLSALVTHGSWPSGVSIGQSASAVRALVGEPGEPASAWPQASADELARPGLFWGLLVGQLMLLFTAAVVVMSALAKRRIRRAERRAAREEARHAGAEARRASAATRRSGAGGAGTGAAGAGAQVPGDVPAAPAGHETATGVPTQVNFGAGTGSSAAHAYPETASDDRTGAAAAAAAQHVPQATAAQPARPEPVRPEPQTSPRAEDQAGPQAGQGASAAALIAPFASSVVADAAPLPRDASPAEVLAEASGPALVVTSDPALWAETVGARGKLGPTHLYDPTHITDAPVRLRWSPERGCQDMETAASRAAALLAPVRSPAKIDEATHDTALTLLRCALHAAAVDGQPFKQAHRWTTVAGSASDAVRILRKHKAAHSGAAGELEAALIGHPERRDEATALIRHAFDCLAQLHVRNSCTTNRADVLALESFVAEGGTLYVLGDSREDPRRDPGAMPLVTALTTHVVELGRRMAARSSSGRLDPPMTVVLDTPATVAPLPTLPVLLAEGPTHGLDVHAHHRSPDQAAAWWPELRARV